MKNQEFEQRRGHKKLNLLSIVRVLMSLIKK